MIQGEKINLRLIKKDDINTLVELVNNLQDRGEYSEVTISSEVSFWKHFNESGFWKEDFGRMLITSKTDSILGNITFYKGAIGYEVGYQIFRKEDRGKGYGSEALKLFSTYIFELKPINRLTISILDGNAASRKLAEKCGYLCEGTMRQAYFARGKYHDIQVFSLLRNEK